MKSKHLLFLSAAAMLAANSGCQKAPTPENEMTSVVTFSSTIASQVTTKATGNTWESNDAIGVFMKTGTGLSNVLASNKQYVTNGNGNFAASSSTEEISYPADGSTVDFIAYYPYTATVSNNALAINVADQSQQNKIDLLYANNVTGASKDNPNAQLNFAHQLSKVELTVSAGTGVSTLSGLAVKYEGLNTTASFDLATGTLGTAANKAAIAAKTTAGTSTTVAEAILLPTSNVDGATVAFTIGSDVYTWTLPSTTTYEASKKYTYNITLQADASGNTVLAATGNITDWVDVPSGSYTIGKDENSGGETDPTGQEQVLYTEDFGATNVTSNTAVASFTGWSNTAVTYSFVGNLTVRTSGFANNNIWFPANATGKITVAGINTSGASKLKFKFDLGLQSVTTNPVDSKNINVILNGQTFHPASVVYSQENGYATNTPYTVEVDLSGATNIPATSTLELEIPDTANLGGVRVDNFSLTGIK